MPSTDTSPDGDAGGCQATLPPPLPVVGILPTDAETAGSRTDATDPTRPARRPWHRATGWWLIAAALLIAALAALVVQSRNADPAAVRSSSTATANVGNDGSTDASGDVVVRAITNDDVLDLGAARLTVTNHSAQRSDYLITVAAESADGSTEIASGLATIDRLPAGGTTTVRAQFTTSLPSDAQVVVKEVSRTASL